jgi:glycosyl transferase family 25
MKSYVINLDRCPDRLVCFEEQAKQVGIEFTRLRAIDARELLPEIVDDPKWKSFQFQPIDLGNLGLLLSHRQAWQELVDSELPHATIFEDDVRLGSNIRSVFDGIDRGDYPFDILKLETTLRRVICSERGESVAPENEMKNLLSWHGGTAGYVISRQAAERLISRWDTMNDIIDLTLFHPESRSVAGLEIKQLVPAVCIQSQFLDASSLPVFASTLGKPATHSRFFRYGPWTDLKRLARRHRDSMRRRTLKRSPSNREMVIPFGDSIQERQAA